jgi:hypothetical protein
MSPNVKHHCTPNFLNVNVTKCKKRKNYEKTKNKKLKDFASSWRSK